MKTAGGTEEAIVTAISPSFCQVMRDNPALVAWLSEALR
jgi:hypothetical protein